MSYTYVSNLLDFSIWLCHRKLRLNASRPVLTAFHYGPSLLTYAQHSGHPTIQTLTRSLTHSAPLFISPVAKFDELAFLQTSPMGLFTLLAFILVKTYIFKILQWLLFASRVKSKLLGTTWPLLHSPAALLTSPLSRFCAPACLVQRQRQGYAILSCPSLVLSLPQECHPSLD